jgi:hypothetical protein
LFTRVVVGARLRIQPRPAEEDAVVGLQLGLLALLDALEGGVGEAHIGAGLDR